MNKIIFFDGVCNLCNQFVDFIIKADKHKKIKVASLQGETANDILEKKQLKDLSTVIYYKDKKTYTQSDAIFEIVKELSWPYKTLIIFKIIPKSIRNFVYDKISRSRYKFFGKRSTCRLPTESEKSRMLP